MVKQYMRRCSLSGELPFPTQAAPVESAPIPAAAILSVLACHSMSVNHMFDLVHVHMLDRGLVRAEHAC